MVSTLSLIAQERLATDPESQHGLTSNIQCVWNLQQSAPTRRPEALDVYANADSYPTTT